MAGYETVELSRNALIASRLVYFCKGILDKPSLTETLMGVVGWVDGRSIDGDGANKAITEAIDKKVIGLSDPGLGGYFRRIFGKPCQDRYFLNEGVDLWQRNV